MNILFVSSAAGVDYLCDTIFHGLRSLFGTAVVDDNRLWYLYAGAKDTDKLYGRGFTVCGNIDEGHVDREDILHKISRKYFDLIVYGSIWRDHRYLNEVRSVYKKNEIVMLDGEDSPLFLRDCPGSALYFKRELNSPQNGVFPIQFSIPEEKIGGCGIKSHFMAPLDPWDTSTYIYETEQKYYQMYRSSMFGKTMRKAGWDCLRHYEIMACNCMPYFMGLEHCPPTIMTDLPKDDLMIIKNLIEYDGGKVFRSHSGREYYMELLLKVENHLLQKLTTKAMAKKLIDTVKAEA